MPFYIRKSVSAGPFRFNFSKGGVGVSVGVKGLRIGTGPRGHYIHAGRGGLYYRATLGGAGQRQQSRATVVRVPSGSSTDNSDVVMVEVDSGDVMEMRDEPFAELLTEINSKTGQVRMSATLAWVVAVIGVIAGLASGGPGFLVCAAALPGWAIGRWFDSYRRSTVLYYDLEGDAEAAYNRLAEGFDDLAKCAGKWHIEAGGAIQNLTAWKRNAGASYLVKRKATTLAYRLPSVIKSNVSPPALHVGKQVMFFMPDVVLVQDGKRVGAVGYPDLRIRWQDSRFIEDDKVPSDARIVDHTWKHPNKSGGPDRRFKDNRQIPICLYESVHFQSDNGVNELVEFSRTGVTASFADGCRLLAGLPRGRKEALPSPATSREVAAIPVEAPTRRRKLRTVALIIVALFFGLPVLGIIFGKPPAPSTAEPPPRTAEASQGASSAADIFPTPNLGTEAPNRAPEAATALVEPPSQPTATVLDTNALPDLGGATTSSEKPQRKVEGSVQSAPGAIPLPEVRYTSTAVNFRQGPGTRHAIILVVEKGTQVSVLATDGGWSRVQVGDLTGWMANSTISTQKPPL